MWPFSCSDEDLARQTPRQTFALLKKGRDAAKSLAGTASEAPTDLPADTPEVRPDLKGIQSIGGGLFNLANVAAWKPEDGEDDRDPFSVDRAKVRERWYTMTYRMCEGGMMGAMGVPKGNMEAARTFADRSWQGNEELYSRLTGAFRLPEAEGRAAIMQMCEETDYPYKCAVADPKTKQPLPGSCVPGREMEWYDFVRARHPELSKPE